MDARFLVQPFPEKVGACASDGCALLKVSSGSTGRAKVVELDAGQVLAEARQLVAGLGLMPGDRILSGAPLFHSYGFDLGVLAALYSGATLSQHEPLVPRRLLAQLSGGEVAVFLGVPSLYRALLAMPPTEPTSLGAARYLLSCTAPLGTLDIEAFAARFAAPLCQHYGSTESGGVSLHCPAEVARRPGSVGLALPGVAVRVFDEAGAEQPAGLEGEVVVSSPSVARGYRVGAPPGRAALSRGTFRTGDVGWLDAEGYLHLRGRLDDMLSIDGLKLYPGEVEETLRLSPKVSEAVVFPFPTPTGGTAVGAAVVLRAAATEEELRAHCRARLADYKVPRCIRIRDALPAGPTGKLLRADPGGSP